MSRQVKNAKDIVTGELVYFVSHAKATYLGDGSTVEDTVNVMKRDIKNITLSNEATTMVSVTYEELKNLRDNGELVPGMQYRITDYETTTSQAGTTSANHPFDIIVTALNESTLSENASAIRSARDTENYFGTENLEAWQLKYCLDNDTKRFAWAKNLHKAEFVAMFWDDPVNGINYDKHIGNDKIYDWGIEYDPETDIDNIVIYKTEVGKYNEVDYNDKYFYRGVVEVDGEKYDSWKKFEDRNNDWVTSDDGQYQYALTERIVFDGQVIWPELKPEIIRIYDSYNCVIKDEYIGSSDDSGYHALSEYIEIAAIMMDDPVNGDPYEYLDKDIFSHFEYETEPNGGYSLYLLGRYLDDGEDSGLCEDQKYYYRGVVSVDGSDFDCWQKCNVCEDGYEIGGEPHKYYFLTNKIVDGNITITESEKSHNGKGVIYNMIDEYGNECPYDFKNIKFYYEGLGTDVYTFTWIDDSYNVMDTSIFGNNGILTCHGNIYGVYGNVIKQRKVRDNSKTKQLLNNITFISDYEYDYNGNEGFCGCYNNSFGNDCHNNSFGNGCNNNTFSSDCYNNSFGNGCYNNSFGNGCNNNTFSSDCYNNIFGNNCYSNSFGNNCYSNSFGNDCYSNSFGNDCYSNSFSNACYGNSFNHYCNGNIFGNRCHNNIFSSNCCGNSFNNQCNTNRLGVGCRYNSFGEHCNNNTFGANCFSNSLGNDSYQNTFGKKCNNNSLGNECYQNILGDECRSNSFGEHCNNNKLSDGSGSNSFGNECHNNKLMPGCYSNSFGNRSWANTLSNSSFGNSFCTNCGGNNLGVSCHYNSFGNYCSFNEFSDRCLYNSFGNDCNSNSFGNDCIGNSFRLSALTTGDLLDYCCSNHFDDGCSYNVIWNGVQPTSSNKLQNINVVRGVSGGSSAYNYINIVDKNADYEIKVAKNSKGETKIYCEADLIK